MRQQITEDTVNEGPELWVKCLVYPQLILLGVLVMPFFGLIALVQFINRLLNPQPAYER